MRFLRYRFPEPVLAELVNLDVANVAERHQVIVLIVQWLPVAVMDLDCACAAALNTSVLGFAPSGAGYPRPVARLRFA